MKKYYISNHAAKASKWLAMAALLVGMTACGEQKNKAVEEQAVGGRTPQTERLLANLVAQAEKGCMFGHHDDPIYGIGWFGEDGRSDVQSVTGDYPAVMSFDLGHLELGNPLSLDSVAFDKIRQESVKQYERGGMVSYSWHLDNPLTGGDAWDVSDSTVVASVLEGGAQHEKFLGWIDRVADFVNSVVTADGVKVPVLFRPWHEHTGSWFWWGQKLCTTEQYKALWRLTYDRFQEKGVDNVLWAYSPGTESNGNEAVYMERYPGDDIIDLLGLDCYVYGSPEDEAAMAAYTRNMETSLEMVCRLAKGHGKAAAITETGFEQIPMSDWWTSKLAPITDKFPISYVLVWRNAFNRANHYYAPYPGHASADDFVKACREKKFLLAKDVNLYE